MRINNSPENPIGIFDSGVGGLTVANAIVNLMPNERIIYFGDTAHLPYGDKSPEAISNYSFGIVNFLINQGCKAIVIACNSASATAFSALKKVYHDKIPIINVVTPLVEEVSQKQYKKVGIIATKATIKSNIYEHKLQITTPNTKVFSLATPLLVPMIEEGFFENKISQTIIDNYLSHKELRDIEAILLCCTHYPLIRDEIAQYFENKVAVYDSGNPVAKFSKLTLQNLHLLNPSPSPKHEFYVSDYTNSFEQTTRFFYGEKIKLQQVNIWNE